MNFKFRASVCPRVCFYNAKSTFTPQNANSDARWWAAWWRGGSFEDDEIDFHFRRSLLETARWWTKIQQWKIFCGPALEGWVCALAIKPGAVFEESFNCEAEFKRYTKDFEIMLSKWNHIGAWKRNTCEHILKWLMILLACLIAFQSGCIPFDRTYNTW